MFVVVTEDWYGGEDKVQVFKDKLEAENYSCSGSEDIIILDFPEQSGRIYIRVTEEYYGGDVKVFTSKEKAREFDQNLDIMILERDI